MIIVDASAVVELLLRSAAAKAIEERVFAAGETLHAPHLIDLEVAQVMRRLCTAGEMEAERGQQALTDLCDLPITRYPHDLLLPRIWELRHNVTAYDAAYLALAEVLPATLLTRDARLASAAEHDAVVELV